MCTVIFVILLSRWLLSQWLLLLAKTVVLFVNTQSATAFARIQECLRRLLQRAWLALTLNRPPSWQTARDIHGKPNKPDHPDSF